MGVPAYGAVVVCLMGSAHPTVLESWRVDVGEIVIQEYEPKYRQSCIDLLSATFRGTSNEQTFQYRFEERSTPPLIIIALDGEDVVSFNSWIPWKFRYEQQELFGFQSGESATDVNHRRKGIFGKILRYADQVVPDKDIDFFFGFPGPMSYSVFFKSGYRPITTSYYSLKLVPPWRKREKNSVREVNPCFAEYLYQQDKITPVLDQEYFSWRYLKNPKKYDIVEYRETSSRALFVLRRQKWKFISELVLLDCQFNNYNQDFIQAAFLNLKKRYAGKAIVCRTYCHGHSDRGQALRRIFRIKVRKGYDVFVVKPVSDKIDENIIYNQNNWDVMPHCVDDI